MKWLESLEVKIQKPSHPQLDPVMLEAESNTKTVALDHVIIVERRVTDAVTVL